MFQQQLVSWYHDLVAFLPTLLLIALIIVLTRFVARRAQGFAQAFVARTEAPVELGLLFGRAARVVVVLAGVLLVLQQLGWHETVLGFVTGLGISGIIIGFALQDIVKQFAAGVLLLMLRPFQVGDVIKVSGFEGSVRDIQVRATVLRTADGDEVLIPNADVYTNAVVNRSRFTLRRRAIAVTLPEGATLEQVRATLPQALVALPRIAAAPQPHVVSTGLADGTPQLELRFWTNTTVDEADEAMTEAIDAVQHQLQALTEDREPKTAPNDRRPKTED